MKRFLLLLITILFCFSSYAQTIQNISITGLKKTKESYIQALLSEFKEQSAEEVDLKAVETILQAEGLFSDINVSIQEGTLVVDVVEKITFMPVPFVSYSSDGFLGGFMLMNMNAFGKKNMIVTGGFFSPVSQMGILVVQKPAMDISHPGFSMFTSFSHKEDRIASYDDSELFEFEYMGGTANINITEKISNFISCSAGLKYTCNVNWGSELSDIHQVSALTGIAFSNIDWNGWFLLSNVLSLRAEVGYSSENEVVRTYDAGFTVQYPLFERFRVGLSANGELDINEHETLQAGKSSVGSTILSSDFRTDRIFNSTFNLEAALTRTSFATLSLYGTYEANIARDYDESFAWSHGPGAGLKMYLKQLALPAMLIGFSYNIPQDEAHFVISAGISY